MVNQATQVAAYVSQMCFELHKLASTTTELSFLAVLLEMASVEASSAQLRLLCKSSSSVKKQGSRRRVA